MPQEKDRDPKRRCPATSREAVGTRFEGPLRVAVNGRVAPTKFLVEIVHAMDIVSRTLPDCELHVFGDAEPRHRDYAEEVRQAAGADAGRTIFHGAGGDTPAACPDFDAFLVLGAGQGSPNALLEALAAGLPCVANDDGGTAEQIIDGRTGLLVPDRTPEGVSPRQSCAWLATAAWPNSSAVPGVATHWLHSPWATWSNVMNRSSSRWHRQWRAAQRSKPHDMFCV